MFNIGFSEVIAIGVIALIVIGPKQLPEVARVVARMLAELKKATQELSGGILEASRDVKNTYEDTKSEIISKGKQFAEELVKEPDSINKGVAKAPLDSAEPSVHHPVVEEKDEQS